MATSDFNTDHLKGESKRIADAIVKFLKKDRLEDPDGGGCKAFYSPQEWKERKESYGTDSKLVLVHDGGDLAPYCNLDYECYPRVEKLAKRLKEMGYYVEQCTCWYSAVYEV